MSFTDVLTIGHIVAHRVLIKDHLALRHGFDLHPAVTVVPVRINGFGKRKTGDDALFEDFRLGPLGFAHFTVMLQGAGDDLGVFVVGILVEILPGFVVRGVVIPVLCDVGVTTVPHTAEGVDVIGDKFVCESTRPLTID